MGESQVFGSFAIFAWQADYAFMLSECLRALASHQKPPVVGAEQSQSK